MIKRKIIFYLLVIAFVFSYYVPVSLASTSFIWPCKGVVLNFFRDGSHRGVDIEASVGTLVKAIASGTVKWIGKTPRGEPYISIEHPGGITSTYLPVKVSDNISKGTFVDQKQIIGAISSEGDVSSNLPHLHLGLYLTSSQGSKKYLDPLEYLPSLLQAREESLSKARGTPVSGVLRGDDLVGGTSFPSTNKDPSWLGFKSRMARAENKQVQGELPKKSLLAQRVIKTSSKQESLKNLVKSTKPQVFYKTELNKSGLLARQIYLSGLQRAANNILVNPGVEKGRSKLSQIPLRKTTNKLLSFPKDFAKSLNIGLKKLSRSKFFLSFVVLLLGGIVWWLKNSQSILNRVGGI